jgi:hypothetical protein
LNKIIAEMFCNWIRGILSLDCRWHYSPQFLLSSHSFMTLGELSILKEIVARSQRVVDLEQNRCCLSGPGRCSVTKSVESLTFNFRRHYCSAQFLLSSGLFPGTGESSILNEIFAAYWVHNWIRRILIVHACWACHRWSLSLPAYISILFKIGFQLISNRVVQKARERRNQKANESSSAVSRM